MRFLPLLFLFVWSASAQTVVEPEHVGLSDERLERLDAMLESHIQEGHFPGALSLVYRKGEIAHFETYGVRTRETGDPVEQDDIFRIYSMSKPITTVAVMMLLEEGHFKLSTPVGRLLPEFADVCVYSEDACVPVARPITVEDLITHTAGLTYGEVLGGTHPVDRMYQEKEILFGRPDLEGFVTDLSSIPLMFQPGERWHYSVSIDVLGRLVEVASGMTFAAFLQERLFDPLGMVDTGFELAEEDRDRLFGMYDVAEDGSLKPAAWAPEESLLDVTFFSGGGGLLSTAADYLRFSRMLLNGGELDDVRILGSKTVDLMMMNHLDVPLAPGLGFGLGGMVVTDVAQTQLPGSEGTFSWSGAANTYFFIDPEEELIAFVWAQYMPYGIHGLQDAMTTAVYQSIID